MTASPGPLDLERLSAQLAGKRGREFWRSLEEAAADAGFIETVAKEVPRLGAMLRGGIDRRRVLQLMAASLTLSGVAACGPEPTRGHWLPYVKQPPGIVPGIDRHYASATVLGGYGTGVLVTHTDGRPIKVEGNPAHPASLGATSHWSQAAILSLYDPERSQTVLKNAHAGTQEGLQAAFAAARASLAPGHGAGLRILTGTVTSPSLTAQIGAVLKQFPRARWHQWEAADRHNAAAGTRLAFGRTVDTVLHLEAADVVLGIGADFLSTAPGHLRYGRDFAKRRRANEVGARMSRVYAIESTPTLVGSIADHRWAPRPDEIAAAVRALAATVGAAPEDWRAAGPPWLAAFAKDLAAHRGTALVQVGAEQPPEIHALGHAINASLGAPGHTLDYIDPVAVTDANDASIGTLDELAGDLHAGRVDTLLILGVNPVFTAPPALGFAEALARVRLSLHLGEYVDETAALCRWHVPEAHQFEAWGDCRAFDGTATIMQPQAEPFYGGLSAQELLARFAGDLTTDGRTMMRRHWGGALNDAAWIDALRGGVIPDTSAKPISPALKPDLVVSLPPAAQPTAPGAIDVLFRPDEGLWDGRFANNGWLQELPRWHTKLVWDNAALVAPLTARRLGLGLGDMIALTAGSATVRLPAFILPGQAPDCVTVAMGFGRRVAGKVASGAGFDVYPLRDRSDPWRRRGVQLRKLGTFYQLVTSQHAERMAGRDLVKTGTLDQFLHDRDFEKEAEKRSPDRADKSLYPGFEYKDEAWAMAINLNSCIGCEACVVACEAENNTPVVGKEEVFRGRLMQWLRIDRYYSGGPDNPETYFQPVPCMHCEEAPCEVVCPVQATVHDSDGLNTMVYNRCVGTRFCSNNCPYKVRRFNFFAYAHLDPRLDEAWNPDVTVRDRGVMEKCTYCVQRVREAKIRADRENRPVRDGEVVTACQAACPTEAIVFGDKNDLHSAVAKRKASPLDYALLEELNTRPRTTYEARLHNRNPELEES